MSNTTKIQIIRSDKDLYLIKRGERYFQVGSIVLEILQLSERGVPVRDIRSEITTRNNLFLDDEYIMQIINRFNGSKGKKTPKYIWGSIRVLKLNKSYWILNILSYMFSLPAVVVVLSLFCFLSIYFNFFEYSVSRDIAADFFKGKYLMWLLFIGCSIIISLIHELGHATASFKFGGRPSEISFGFYLFFPVMFTDVSSSWELNRSNRLVIDFAGIYFQIMSMVLLMIVGYFADSFFVVSRLLVWENMFLILYNLNPLFRFDGYWIFSDFFELTNLRQKSLMAFKDLISVGCNIFNKSKILKRRFPLIIYIYSIISNIFLIVVLIIFLRFSGNTISNTCLSIRGFIFEKQSVDWLSTMLKLTSIVIGGYCILRSVFYKYHFFKK